RSRRAARPGDVGRQDPAGHRRAGRVRPGRGGTRRPGAARRRPRQRPLAVRVPLLAGGDHLRRERRDPAQHRRPAPARPGAGPVMDAAVRALLAETLRRAASRHTGPDLDAALDDLGWRDALAADPRAAVPALFEAQGSAGSTSAALDDVVVAALAVEPAPDLAAVLPPLGTWGA